MKYPKPSKSKPQRERRIARNGGLTFKQGAAIVWDTRPHRCEECGKALRLCRSHNVHHIVHRKHGGTNEPGNLALLCANCHDARHGLPPTPDDWRDN